MNFSAFHGDQLEYNDSQGANGASLAARIQPQEHEIDERLVHNLCTDTIVHIEQLLLVVKQCLLHASNKSDHLQLRPEAAVILQFLSCFGDLTSWNIRL